MLFSLVSLSEYHDNFLNFEANDDHSLQQFQWESFCVRIKDGYILIRSIQSENVRIRRYFEMLTSYSEKIFELLMTDIEPEQRETFLRQDFIYVHHFKIGLKHSIIYDAEVDCVTKEDPPKNVELITSSTYKMAKDKRFGLYNLHAKCYLSDTDLIFIGV